MLKIDFHIGDFIKDTAHLSHAECGMYLRMLMRYYDKELPLPSDETTLYRQFSARSTDDQQMLNGLLDEFFSRSDDGWAHHRANLELEKANARIEQAREAGKASAQARATKKAAPGKGSLDAGSSTVKPKPVQPSNGGADSVQPTISQQPQTINHQPAVTSSEPLAGELLPAAQSKTAQETEYQTAARSTWNAYAAAYAQRYGSAPLRNAKSNAAIKSFIQQVGYTDAPAVATFYVTSVNEQYIVKRMHDATLLSQQAQAWYTQWKTGRTITNQQARQLDNTATNASAAAEAMRIIRERGNPQ